MKKLNCLFKSVAIFFERKKAVRDAGRGRILLGNNTEDGTVMLQQIRLIEFGF